MDEYQSEDNIAETSIRGHLNKNSAATVWDDTSIKTEQPTSLNGWKDHCSTNTDIDLERLAGKLRQSTRTEKHPEQSDFSVDEVLKSSSTPYIETRHSLQRRFKGKRLTPHTAPWIAQRLHEDKTPVAIGILLAWVHPK